MITLVAVSLLGISLLSLATTVAAIVDVRRGRPRLASVQMLTGIVDKAEIERRLGRPDAVDRLKVEPAKVYALRRPEATFLNDPVIEAGMITALSVAIAIPDPRAVMVVATAAVYCAVRWSLASMLAAGSRADD